MISSGVAEQGLSLIKVVRSHGNEEFEAGRYRDRVNALMDLEFSHGKLYGLNRVFNGGVDTLLMAAVLALGVSFVSAGILPKEALISFVL